MRKSTLVANSLILSLGCVLCLAIITYLLPFNIALTPATLVIFGLILTLTLMAVFAIYLHKKFRANKNQKHAPETVLINETWLLKH